MVLLPFFQNNVFKKLEIVCKHVPKWFDNEFGVLKLDVRTEESADGLCHAVVFPRTTMKNSGEKNDTRKSLNNTCESNTCKSSDNIRETSNIIRESFNVNGKIPDIIRMNSNEVSINSIEVKNTLLAKHPCFDIKARHTHARVHLPVAPKCNIQCNYCNRQYDCVNESRPGVTSAVLSPYQAVEYLKELDKHIDNLSVIGIAGPGDPFANPEETLQTMRLVKEVFPDRIFCLSTNGLNLRPYINEIAELGVTHVTITINAVDPEIGAKIYSWIRYEKHIYRDVAAAEIILRRQLKCIPLLKEKGITVKINTVILPGINDHHIEKIAQKVAELGADVMNCIPLVPNKDTVFKTMQKPPADMVKLVREQSKKYIGMMTHCARCRADAAGLLGQDFSGAIGLLQEFALRPAVPTKDRPYTAIATYEGMLVNAHLGDADSLYIYRQTPNGFQYVEERATPEAGCGDQRWYNIATLLKDCRALLASGVGPNPLKILQGSGLRVIQMTGLIDDGLEAVYNGKFIKTVQEPAAFRCGEGCGGNARGCA
jgi:nitrogen fixation protein NifB